MIYFRVAITGISLLDCFPQRTKQLWPSCFLSILILTWAQIKLVTSYAAPPCAVGIPHLAVSLLMPLHPAQAGPLVIQLHEIKVCLEKGKRETITSSKASNYTEWSVTDVTVWIISFFCFNIGDQGVGKRIESHELLRGFALNLSIPCTTSACCFAFFPATLESPESVRNR